MTRPAGALVPDPTAPGAMPDDLRAALGDELEQLGVRGAACEAVLHTLAIRARDDWPAARQRRRARRLVDAWLRGCITRLDLLAMPDLATRRAALLALDLDTQWPTLTPAAPPPEFLAALHAALPLAMPPPAPLAMPTQNLHQRAAPAQSVPRPGRYGWRRAGVFGASLALVAAALAMLAQVFAPGGLTAIEIALMLLFALNFGWLALGFWSALIGLVVTLRGGDRAGLAPPLPSGQPLREAFTRPLAVVIPIYNEDASRVMCALEVLHDELAGLEPDAPFEFLVLSDSTDAAHWLAEEAAWDATRRRLGATGKFFYRRRYRNEARKAGNIADFCTRWGARYEAMLVLDADSVMSGATVITLARLLATNPQAAILQTVPRLVNRQTPFARAQQFATALYGPVLATGYAWWFGPDSNYWGHNALIRISAFAAHAGMPVLPGAPPFGGHVLSHDFVEAALLRRAGWRNYLLPHLEGSYEESPPTLLDHAARDRRWCQGNLQHAGIVGARGLHPLSRFHLLNGIMAYVAAPLWLAFIVTGLAAGVQGKLELPVYFFPDRTPYPVWHVMDPVLARWLLFGTMAVLLAPKLFGWCAVAWRGDRARGFGGRLRSFVGMLAEIIYSTLSAPAQMLLQTRAIREVLGRRDAGWNTQARDDRGISYASCHARLGGHAVLGALFAGAAWYVYPGLLAWMLPVVLGLLVAAPLAWLGARPALGRRLLKMGLCVTPEERDPPPVLRRLAALTAAAPPPDPVGDLRGLLASPSAAARHLALLSQLPPRELTASMALARCRAADASLATLGQLYPRELETAALSDRQTVSTLVARCGARTHVSHAR